LQQTLEEFNHQLRARAQRYPISQIGICVGPGPQMEAAMLAADAVLSACGLPILIFPGSELQDLDGLVVAGPPGALSEAELASGRMAVENNLPYLGSVRGALLLNVAAGGTVTSRSARLLDVSVDPASRLYDIVGSSYSLGDSASPQVIERLAPIFYSVTKGGVTEGFQRKSTPVQAGYLFAAEQQWLHDARLIMLFHHLVRDGRMYRSRMTRTG
jgi:hypothetical protein